MAETWFFEVLVQRPRPFPDECMSGYLLRLAQVNGFAIFWDLASDLFPTWKAPQQIGLLRWEYPLEGWGRIPLRTQLPVEALKRLTVAPWIEKFRTPSDLSRSIYLSPGYFLKGVVNPSLRVCPSCLQEQPYIRLTWRLAPVCACVEHGCWLQDRCVACGALLIAAGQASQHMRCSVCEVDLRRLPVAAAPDEVLEAQRQEILSLRFLLDPAVVLAKPVDTDGSSAQAIGLKFRYLRSQMGLSLKALAQRIGLAEGKLTELELGQQVLYPSYQTYLKALGLSWADFAALEIPGGFVDDLHTPRHLSLRLCPNPDCPNHQLPPSLKVRLLADLPERRAARFRCTACGRSFTRSYDGRLTAKPRRPSIHPGEPPIVPKSAEEIALLKEWGLQGEDNRRIAHRLGWGEKTVRMYWIALGLEEQVHRAQSERRAKEKQQRLVAMRARLEGILRPLLNQDEVITLCQLSRDLERNDDYLHNDPDLAAWVRAWVEPHNARVRQRRRETITTRVVRALEGLKSSDRKVKVEEIAQQAGLTYTKLRKAFPELLPILHEALVEHQARLRARQLQAQIEQIDAAAARLIARGTRLNYKVILQEAGLSQHSDKNPLLREALLRWNGNFAPRD